MRHPHHRAILQTTSYTCEMQDLDHIHVLHCHRLPENEANHAGGIADDVYDMAVVSQITGEIYPERNDLLHSCFLLLL